MTIKECIDIVDNIKPNGYSIKDKVMWLSFIDEIIINDVLRTHEGYDGKYDTFTGYTDENLSEMLIAPSPYDRLYTAYLEMKIDEKNGETARYNNSMTLFNTYMLEYRKYYNKTHMPLDVTDKRMRTAPKKPTVGISDAEFENLKRELYAMLSEALSDVTSPDKIQDVIRSFVINNVAMLKGKDGANGIDGKDGYTPQKGIDYFDGKDGKPFRYEDFTAEQLESLKGENGADGHTPVRGTDYWTEKDKNEIVGEMQILIDGKQDKFDEETLEYIANLENLSDLVGNTFLMVVQKQSKLSEEQLYDLNDIGNIRNTAMGADATASVAMNTAGTAYDRTVELEESKKDKVDITYDLTNSQIAFDMLNMDNSELRCKVALTDLGITFQNGEYSDAYLSGLSFYSGDAPTHVIYAGGGIINWVGVDCTTSEGSSIFQPSANTHYDIVFYYNGTQMIGSVNGFKPADRN